MKTTRLRINMSDVVPAVVRVVDVPVDSTLPELHDLLQVALGWTDTHLHQFVTAERSYAVPDEDDWQEVHDERKARLSDLPCHFRYLYDFGDGWEHEVEVLGDGAGEPGCVEGTGMCPPEDCGGPWGYAHLLDVLAEPGHDEYDDLATWAGTLRPFDRSGTHLLVRQTVGEVPPSTRLLLELVGDGVRLTPGGRLPRALVRQVQAQREGWYGLRRPASTEDDLRPLCVLRDVLRSVGLLRMRGGLLSVTKAAADDRQVVRRLRSYFAADSLDASMAAIVPALLVAGGAQTVEQLAPQLLPMLGRGWVRDGRPLDVSGLRSEMYGLSTLMRGLDLVAGELVWAAGPSALTLLPGATALAAMLALAG